jgi:hypothetical protein
MNEDPTVLLAEDGRELLARLAAGLDGGPLAVGERLRRDFPAALVAAAMAQHALRLAATAKFSRAAQMLFTRAGYEQSSAEQVARHRAARLNFATASRVADLCCGIGGDLIALAAVTDVLAVDRDPVHATLAKHNAAVYGVADRTQVIVADVRDLGLKGLDAVFIDPARRSGPGTATASPGTAGPPARAPGSAPGGAHRFRAGLSEPPLDWCLGLTEQVKGVAIKAAPGLPAELIPPHWEAEFIADGRDLKEAVLWSPHLATTQRRATILPTGDTLTRLEGDEVPLAEPREYLLDPNPAVTRAGLVEDLARTVDAAKIDPRIAFLTTDKETRTPFARTLRVLASAPWHEKAFAKRLKDLDIGAVDIRRRGLAGDVDQIRRRLKLTGHHRATVVITRVNDTPWGLICVDL